MLTSPPKTAQVLSEAVSVMDLPASVSVSKRSLTAETSTVSASVTWGFQFEVDMAGLELQMMFTSPTKDNI
jgi:hypothetical protein